MAQETEQWTVNMNMGDWAPRKATAEEIAEHNTEREKIRKTVEALGAINKILVAQNLKMSQNKEDLFGVDYPIEIGGVSTFIDNETGLLFLPQIENEWDENTIVQRRMPFPFGLNNSVYTMTSYQGENDERSVATDAK